jgi:hypothetical protein
MGDACEDEEPVDEPPVRGPPAPELRRPSIGHPGTVRPRSARHRERAGELALLAADSLDADVSAETDAIVRGAATLAVSSRDGDSSGDGDGVAQLAAPAVMAPADDDGGGGGTGSGSGDDGACVTIAVGTTNRAKLQAVEAAASRMFAAHSVQPCAAKRYCATASAHGWPQHRASSSSVLAAH